VFEDRVIRKDGGPAAGGKDRLVEPAMSEVEPGLPLVGEIRQRSGLDVERAHGHEDAELRKRCDDSKD